MANTKSAIKRARQNLRRRERNQSAFSQMTTAVKEVKQAIQGKDAARAKTALTKAIPLIDKAAQTKLIHANNASRKISRLAAQVYSLR